MEFTTKGGVEIPLRSVGRRYVQQIFSKYEFPDPPTYTVELVGGGTQTFPHNVTKEGSTLVTPEDVKAWAEYQDEVVTITGTRFEKLIHFLLYECVLLDPPPVEEWSVDHDAWGLEVPDPQEDKVAHKVFWIDNELLVDPDDQAALVALLYQDAGIIGADDVAEFELFFRSTVERLASS